THWAQARRSLSLCSHKSPDQLEDWTQEGICSINRLCIILWALEDGVKKRATMGKSLNRAYGRRSNCSISRVLTKTWKRNSSPWALSDASRRSLSICSRI